MGKDAVLEGRLQARRKIRDLRGVVVDHFRADHDMAEKLAVVGILVDGKIRKLIDLADIVKHRGRDEQVPVDIRIALGKEIAEARDREGVLQKTADEAVMNRLGRRVGAELDDELTVVDKEAL